MTIYSGSVNSYAVKYKTIDGKSFCDFIGIKEFSGDSDDSRV